MKLRFLRQSSRKVSRRGGSARAPFRRSGQAVPLGRIVCLWLLALAIAAAGPGLLHAQEAAGGSVPQAQPEALPSAAPGEDEAAAAATALDQAKAATLIHMRANRFAEAMPFAEEALRLSEKLYGPEAAETGLSAHNLGFALRQTGRLPEAQANLERALAIHERVKPAVHEDTRNVIGELGQIYLRAGRGDEILAIYDRLIARAANEGDAKHVGVAHMHNNAAFLLRILKRPDEAEKRWQSAIALYNEQPLQDEESYRLAVEALLDRYGGLGRTEEARALLASSLETLRSHGQGEGKAALRLLGRASRLEQESGHYAQARDHAAAALAIMDRVAPDAITQTGEAVEPLNNLARAERGLANYTAAEQHYKRAIAILDKQGDVPNAGILNDNLAVLYGFMGRLDEAERHSRRALQLLEQAFGPDHRNVGRAAGNFGVLLTEAARYSEAEPFLRRALTITEAQSPQDPVTLAVIADNLAGVLRLTGRQQAAMEQSQRALDTFEKNLPANHPSLATVRNNLGRLLLDMGRYEEAGAPLRQALQADEAIFGPDHMAVAVKATNLAEFHFRKGERVQAQALLRRALAIFERQFGPSHSKLVHPLLLMGWVELADNRPKQALELFERAVSISIAWRTRLGEKAQRIQEGRGKDVLQGLLDALWRSGPEGDEARAVQALEFGQWKTMTAASAALTALGARSGAADPALGALTRERQDLASEWLAADKRQTELLSQGNRDAALELSMRERLDAIEKRLSAIDGELQAKFPRYRDLARPAPLPRDDLRRLLRADEAAIQYVVTQDSTYVWAISRTQTKWLRLPVGEEDLLTLVRSIRCGLDRAEWTGRGRERCLRLLKLPAETTLGDADQPPFPAEHAHAAHKILLAPLADVIAGKHLLIVPSGPLTSLPFQVLITEKPEADIVMDGAGFERVSWLGRKQALTVLPSLSSLRALREFAKTSRAASPFLGIGNPLLAGQDGADRSAWARQNCGPMDGPPAIRAMEMASLSPSPQILRGGLGNVEVLRHLMPLPETADELCGVAKFLGAPKEAVLLGADATETRVKALSAKGVLADTRILHLATHGLLAGEAETFLASRAEPSLILTPPETATEADDGLLTASEVATLKLDADWVILSACNTAGYEHVGAEALSGLARAFFYAGARSLLVSHWAVDSDATVKLITRAFEEMAGNPGLTQAEALQRSMVALIDGGGRMAHPASWAPFSVVGSPGAAQDDATPQLTAAPQEKSPPPEIAAASVAAIPIALPPLPVRGRIAVAAVSVNEDAAKEEFPPLPVRGRIAVAAASASEDAIKEEFPPLPVRAPVSRRATAKPQGGAAQSAVVKPTANSAQSAAVKPAASASQSAVPRLRSRRASPAESESENWEGDGEVFAR
jgi:CHAT domain-containing protein/Tfp pilus assembly protein PilF